MSERVYRQTWRDPAAFVVICVCCDCFLVTIKNTHFILISFFFLSTKQNKTNETDSQQMENNKTGYLGNTHPIAGYDNRYNAIPLHPNMMFAPTAFHQQPSPFQQQPSPSQPQPPFQQQPSSSQQQQPFQQQPQPSFQQQPLYQQQIYQRFPQRLLEVSGPPLSLTTEHSPPQKQFQFAQQFQQQQIFQQQPYPLQPISLPHPSNETSQQFQQQQQQFQPQHHLQPIPLPQPSNEPIPNHFSCKIALNAKTNTTEANIKSWNQPQEWSVIQQMKTESNKLSAAACELNNKIHDAQVERMKNKDKNVAEEEYDKALNKIKIARHDYECAKPKYESFKEMTETEMKTLMDDAKEHLDKEEEEFRQATVKYNKQIAIIEQMKPFSFDPSAMEASMEEFRKKKEEQMAKQDKMPLTKEDADFDKVSFQYKVFDWFGPKATIQKKRREASYLHMTICENKAKIEALESVVRGLYDHTRETGYKLIDQYETIRIKYPTGEYVEFKCIKGDPFVVDNEKEFIEKTGATLEHIPLDNYTRENFFIRKNKHVYKISIDEFASENDQGHWFYKNFKPDGEWILPDFRAKDAPVKKTTCEIADGAVRVTTQ